MIKSFVALALIVCSLVGFAARASAHPSPVVASVASPVASIVDFPPLAFEGMGSVDLHKASASRPTTHHPHAHAPKVVPVPVDAAPLAHVTMRCSYMHENLIGGANSVCTVTL